MTGEALGVIKCGVAGKITVRVMTGYATEPWICWVMSRTKEQSIRLKPNVIDAASQLRHVRYFIHAAMTRTTKLLSKFVGVQIRRIEDVGLFISISFGLHCQDMFPAGPMTSFTTQPGHHAVEFQTVVTNSPSR